MSNWYKQYRLAYGNVWGEEAPAYYDHLHQDNDEVIWVYEPRRGSFQAQVANGKNTQHYDLYPTIDQSRYYVGRMDPNTGDVIMTVPYDPQRPEPDVIKTDQALIFDQLQAQFGVRPKMKFQQ